MAMVSSSDFLRAPERPTAIATLTHPRHLTPSCGGLTPTAERTVGPARISLESLTPRPGIREQYRHFSDMAGSADNVRFSNRPFGVKHFQTIHQCGVDVARGLLLLFGIGTWALPPWDPRTRRNNLLDDLAVSVTAGPSGHTNSPHPSSRKGHLSTARWSSKFSPIGFDPERFSCCCRGLLPGPPELGAVNPDAVHDHGQPARQGHDRLFHPAALSDLHGPRLKPRPFF